MKNFSKQSALIYLGAVAAACILGQCLRLPFSENANAAGNSGTGSGIVSLFPSTTDILFALGLEDEIAAVTRFCLMPEGVDKPVVGGLYDLNYEYLIGLRPSHVVLIKEQSRFSFLERFGVHTVAVDQSSIEGVMESISLLGAQFHRKERARELRENMRLRIERVKKSVSGMERLRTLVCVDRSSGPVKDMYAAVSGSFYNELLTIAGGKNVCDLPGAYRRLSTEAVVYLDPDVIIDIMPEAGVGKGGVTQSYAQDWAVLATVSAVRSGRVYAITDPYCAMPGIHCVDILEKIYTVFHGRQGDG